MRWSRILTLVASSSLVLSGDMAAYVRADNIDVIFDGVKSTRESLKPCRFNLGSSLDMTDKDGKIQSIHTDWLVTVMLEESVFVRKSGGSSSLLRQHEVVVLSDNSVAVYSLSMGSGADAFDPRLLGLCIGPHYNSNIPNALRVGDRQEKMIKDDILGEIVCKNISVRDAEKHRLTFWIDPKQRFQVLRYEYDSPGILLETVESKYDNKFAEGQQRKYGIAHGRHQHSVAWRPPLVGYRKWPW